MSGTIIQQGRFTSAGEAVELQIRSDVDWMKVINYTVADDDTQTTAVGVEYYWQRGMPADGGIEYKKSNAANAAQLTTALSSGGFTLLDTSGSPLGALNSTITAVSNAAIPVVTNTGVNGLVAGDVVRLTNIAGAQQLGGIDFTVGVNTLTNTTFSLDYMSQIVAGTTGSWRKINFQPQFYPRHRTITSISQAASAVIVMSVTHGFTVGQKVRLKVPEACGMVEINNREATILAVNTTTNSITVDIDSTAFTPFAFPVTTAVPFTQPLVVPIGEAASEAYANLLDDATNNVSFLGMKLAAGADSPAGSASDVIYWVAGKSFSVSNS